MKIDAALRILAVGTLCAAGLITLVVREGLARASGTEIILSMEAVDPRSLLSGHYVIIRLREAAPAGAECPPGTEASLLDGWVALVQDGDRHRVAGMATSREDALMLAPIAVRGHAQCFERGDGSIVDASIGVDRFYINQAHAEGIERIMWAQQPGERRVSAIVSAGKDGKARIKGLMVDGERIESRWF